MKNSYFRMDLSCLGYSDAHEYYRKENELEQFEIGRVILEHRDRYTVQGDGEEFEAELIGSLRFTCKTRMDLPAVGDWVAMAKYDDGKALIHAIYPRHSIIRRKSAGKTNDIQVIATNVDFGLIVQAVDRDFNINRLERYLTICNDAAVTPIIVLNKIDLVTNEVLSNIKSTVRERQPDLLTCETSLAENGYDALTEIIENGKTYCLLGSSGVGKSTILNHLLGREQMSTSHISTSVNKGRHTTSHRELVVLESGGIIIDNPGMREVGIADAAIGLETTFEKILELSIACKFKDCTHTTEVGCVVLEALENGEINEASYANFRKMEKERLHYEQDALDRRRGDKKFGKMIKNIQKERRKNKY